MKKRIISVLLIIAIAFALTGCGKKAPTSVPEYAYIYDIFETAGETYTLKCSGEDTFVCSMSDDSRFISIPGGEYTVWSKSQNLLYYGDGYKICSSTIDGTEKRTVWELPDGGKSDFVRAELASDSMLLLTCSRGEKNSAFDSKDNPYRYTVYEYYALDPATGEARKAIDSAHYTELPSFMGCYGDKVYYLIQPEGGTVYVKCADLKSGENTVLGSFETDESINGVDVSSCILGNTLYFAFEPSSIYSGIYVIELDMVEKLGGSVVRITPDNGEVPEMRYINGMCQWENKVYILLWNNLTNPTATVCRWDTLTNKLTNADSGGETFPEILDFYVNGRDFTVTDGINVTTGTLK